MGRAIFISLIKLYLMPGMVPEIYRKDITVVENEIDQTEKLLFLKLTKY